MNIQSLQIVKRTVVGMSVLFLSGFGAYPLIDIGIVRAATTPCIITVFGKQYDVALLQTGHSGGNIFTCGTDMTAVYQSMHGTNVSRITPYLLAISSPTPTLAPPVVTPTPVPSGASGTGGSTPSPAPTIIQSSDAKSTMDAVEDDDDENEDADEERDDQDEHEEYDKETVQIQQLTVVHQPRDESDHARAHGGSEHDED